MKKLLVFVVGPTAIGKTSIAIDLANHFNTEIISCDSRQFYKEMNIGTAKPSPNEIKKIKHHLIGNISVNKDYNISEFTNDADNILRSILNKKNIAILVGGSGLYIESLIFGIDQIPEVSLDLRNKLNDDLKNNGIKFLQDQLKKIDPEYLVELCNKDMANLIDLRNSDEFELGHIVGSKNIPFLDIETRSNEIKNDEVKALVLICDMGMNSPNAGEKLKKLEYKNILILRGGINSWKISNLPLVTN